jgi:hypothetical protein
MLKHIYLLIILVASGLASAQETCESLLSGIQETLAKTESLTRTMTLKAGFIEIMSMATLVKQTPAGLEFTVLERSGRTPPGDAPNNEFEEGWFGPIDMSNLSCEGHTLRSQEDQYQLELKSSQGNSPTRDLVLKINKINDDYFVNHFSAKVKAPNMPFAATVNTSTKDWKLK